MESLKYLFKYTDKNKLNETQEKFYLEEYKIFTAAIFETDKKIFKLSSITIASSITLISWIGTNVFKWGDVQIPLQLAYASLVPNFFLIPAFIYLIAQRIDLSKYL